MTLELEKEMNYYCLLWILSRWRIPDYNRKMVSRNWKCKEAKKVIGNVRTAEAMGWYVFNSRACLSPEINRFSHTNSNIRRTESYLTKIKSCCRVVSCSKIVSASLFEIHMRAYVFDHVGWFSWVFSFWLFALSGKKRQQRKHAVHSRMTVTGVGSQLIWGSAWLLFCR